VGTWFLPQENGRDPRCHPSVCSVVDLLVAGNPAELLVDLEPEIGLRTDNMKNIRLRLYLSRPTPQAEQTAANLRELCAQRGRACDIEIIDVFADPDRAESDRVIATPTLVRVAPPPVRRIIGDLTDKYRTLAALGLRESDDVQGLGAS
jgi:circadian clock protein KaiB